MFEVVAQRIYIGHPAGKVEVSADSIVPGTTYTVMANAELPQEIRDLRAEVERLEAAVRQALKEPYDECRRVLEAALGGGEGG